MIEYFFGPLMYWLIVGNLVVGWWTPTIIDPMDLVVELNGGWNGREDTNESTTVPGN